MNEESLRAIRDLHTILWQSAVDPKPKKDQRNIQKTRNHDHYINTLKSLQHATTSKVCKHVNDPLSITFSRNKITSQSLIPATTCSSRNTNKKSDSPKEFPCSSSYLGNVDSQRFPMLKTQAMLTGTAVGHLGVGSRPALPGRGLAPFFATSSKALGGFRWHRWKAGFLGGMFFRCLPGPYCWWKKFFGDFQLRLIFFKMLFNPIVYLHVVSNILQGGARVLSSTIG